MAAIDNPCKNSRFIVEIDGILQAGFTEVVLSSASSDIIEYREGETPKVSKIPGLTKYSNLVLKRGVTGSMELYNWYKKVEEGEISIPRKKVSIVLLDEQGNEYARWNFVNAWPTKYAAPYLNARGNEIAIETLEIAHEGMTRAK